MGLDIQRPDQEDHLQPWEQQMHHASVLHRRESCSCTAILKQFLNQELKEHEHDEEFNYCQRDTTDRARLTTITATNEEYKETLIDVIDDLTRHFYIAKLKTTSSWYKTKSTATTGVKSTASYIPWLHLGPDGSLQHYLLCFISDDNNHYTSFLYQVQTMLVD